jgi:transcriptional regulator with XRE-family HTH domain
MDNTAKPGAILKSLRLQKGWKLSDVAAKTGFSVSALSKIENDRIALSYDKIARLSKGLGVDIGVFFADAPAPARPAPATGRRSIIRKDDGRVIETENYLHRFLAADMLNKRFVPIIGEVRSRSIDEFTDLIRHSGDEYTYVLEGVLELHTEFYAPLRLEAGESIYFDSGMGHAYVNGGEGRCRLLTICSGEESQLMTTFDKAEPDSATAEPIEATAAPTKRRRAAPR